MENKKKTWGGARSGAGRKTVGRKRVLYARISQEAYDYLTEVAENNISEYVNNLLLRQKNNC